MVPIFVHPIKVALIEAMFRIRQPLSATDLREVFFKAYPLPNIAYHLSMLKEAGVVMKVDQRQVRGATEKFFVLRQR